MATIASMTAFARRERHGDWGQLVWELRSVNHRYLETQVRLPEDLRGLEGEVRDRVGRVVSRGKVECALRFQPAAVGAAELALDEALAERLIEACRRLADRLPEAGAVDPVDILRWPGVVQQAQPDTGPVEAAALELIDEALAELGAMREREGERVRQMLEQRCDAVLEHVERERARRPEVVERLRERMRGRIEDLGAQPDPGRLEQELALAAQKLDIDEELDRLQSHVSEVRSVLVGDEPVGRRLNFLMQELNREANTLGSKAADTETSRASVDLKVLIEQMREQVQNLE